MNLTASKLNVPEATLRRLIYYRRCLDGFEKEGVNFIQSEDISRKCGVKSSVVRKDLSYFGDFGVRGKGYNVSQLKEELESLFNDSKRIRTALIGAGKLGKAIIEHSRENFLTEIVAAFDVDQSKIGSEISGVKIYSVSDLETIIKKEDIKVSIIAIPPDSVQQIVDRLVNSGIKAILSLALVPINVPEDVEVSFLDVLSEVEYLYFKYSLRRNK